MDRCWQLVLDCLDTELAPFSKGTLGAVVETLEQGLSWHEAAKRAALEISQSTVYRLRQWVWKVGEQALHEGRHGHPIKRRGEVRMHKREWA